MTRDSSSATASQGNFGQSFGGATVRCSPVGSPSSRSEASKSSKKSSRSLPREAIKVLRDWVSTHHKDPYPTEEEAEDLIKETKLTRIQIRCWLANARRRGQVKPPKAQPLSQHTSPEPLDKDISAEGYPHSDASLVHSDANCSRTSYPGSSCSRNSPSVLDLVGQRGRRRRRQNGSKAVHNSARLFQCTFCIKTFKFKHDWQRHEKSLHLVFEQWVCGYGVSLSTTGECAFCGFHNPDHKHYETHKFTICQEQSLEKRTFYRKDHLQQHLRLLHGCQFLASTMGSWKIATPRIHSRCGFCGLKMDTWEARTDHLANHFKSGKSMADWQGSWGFDEQVQKLVENGI
jgi:hypothetical protein